MKLVKIWLSWVESSVEGNPPHHKLVVQAMPKSLRLFDGLTLYVEMGRPITLNVRLHSLTSSVQSRIILFTDSSGGSIEVMEAVGQRWKSRHGSCAMLSFDSSGVVAFIMRSVWLRSIGAFAIGIFDKNHGFKVIAAW